MQQSGQLIPASLDAVIGAGVLDEAKQSEGGASSDGMKTEAAQAVIVADVTPPEGDKPTEAAKVEDKKPDSSDDMPKKEAVQPQKTSSSDVKPNENVKKEKGKQPVSNVKTINPSDDDGW